MSAQESFDIDMFWMNYAKDSKPMKEEKKAFFGTTWTLKATRGGRGAFDVNLRCDVNHKDQRFDTTIELFFVKEKEQFEEKKTAVFTAKWSKYDIFHSTLNKLKKHKNHINIRVSVTLNRPILIVDEELDNNGPQDPNNLLLTIKCPEMPTQDVVSDVVDHKGANWQLTLKLDGKSCTMLVKCSKPPGNADGALEVKADLKPKVYTEGGRFPFSGKMVTRHVFTDEKPEYEFYPFDLSCIVPAQITDGCKLCFQASVKVLQSQKRKVKTENRDDFDVIIGQRMFTVPISLTLQSKFFGRYFKKLHQKKSQDHLALQNVVPEDFDTFLRFLKGEVAFTELNVEALVGLFQLFEMTTDAKSAELYIIQSSISNRKKFRLADQFKLKNLMEHLKGQANSIWEVMNMLPQDRTSLDTDTQAAFFLHITMLCDEYPQDLIFPRPML